MCENVLYRNILLLVCHKPQPVEHNRICEASNDTLLQETDECNREDAEEWVMGQGLAVPSVMAARERLSRCLPFCCLFGFGILLQ